MILWSIRTLWYKGSAENEEKWQVRKRVKHCKTQVESWLFRFFPDFGFLCLFVYLSRITFWGRGAPPLPPGAPRRRRWPLGGRPPPKKTWKHESPTNYFPHKSKGFYVLQTNRKLEHVNNLHLQSNVRTRNKIAWVWCLLLKANSPIHTYCSISGCEALNYILRCSQRGIWHVYGRYPKYTQCMEK